jgi:cell pole-organizing protein PopZ
MASQAAEAVVQQLGGAQREPSMEEILASIRRIIEDSDTTRSAQETAFPAAANSSSPSMGARDVDAFREELHASAEPIAVRRSRSPHRRWRKQSLSRSLCP